MTLSSKSRGNVRSPVGRSRGGFLIGLFAGLLLGLAVALGVAFYVNKTPFPFMSKSGTPADAAKPQAPGAPGAKPPVISGLPQTPAPEKPKFDFYKILPGGEEPVSDKDLQKLQAAKGQTSAGEIYYLQAGSFQSPVDADNQKAKLAVIGLDSSIEPANVPDKGVWYRVRLGPYTRVDDINRVRQTLAQNGIEANLVKLQTPNAPNKVN